jgi:hypothetical protein
MTLQFLPMIFADFLAIVYELLSSTHTFEHSVFAAYSYKEYLVILIKSVMETI